MQKAINQTNHPVKKLDGFLKGSSLKDVGCDNALHRNDEAYSRGGGKASLKHIKNALIPCTKSIDVLFFENNV